MKFLTDAMLGKLTRFLRIFGYDTVYANDLEEYFGLSPVPDEKLKEYAEENSRIVITKDYPFYKTLMENHVFLEGEGVYNYLVQLSNKLDLKYDFEIVDAKCSICNSNLTPVQNKEQVKDIVKPETYNNYSNYYQCSSCKKIYWKGSHIDQIIDKLKEKLK